MSKKVTLQTQLEELREELDQTREDLTEAERKLAAEQQKVEGYKEEVGRLKQAQAEREETGGQPSSEEVVRAFEQKIANLKREIDHERAK